MRSASDRRVGLCLDIDGTVYRGGSVFVETLVRLPDAPGCSFSATERARLRRAVGVVGRYAGGRATAWRWRGTLWLVDALRTVDGRAAETVLDGLTALQGRLSGDGTGRDGPRGTGTYEGMRRSLLRRYGSAVAGRDRAALRDGVAGLFDGRAPLDAGTASALSEAARSGVDVAFVTDMPEHVAGPFAEVAVDAPVRAVVGTRFETDAAGRFTGGFEPVDKRAAVDGLRDRHGWEEVVAAGDTERDLGMAAAADRFVGVGGRGRIRDALDAPTVVGGNPQARTEAPTSGSDASDGDVVYVPPGQSLGPVLRVVLGFD